MARDRSPHSIGAALIRILGFEDKETRNIVNQYVKNYREMFPREMLKRDDEDRGPQREATWQLDPSADTLLVNILMLHSVMNKAQKVTRIIMGTDNEKELTRLLEQAGAEIAAKLHAYRFWYKNYSKFKQLLLNGKIDFTSVNLNHLLDGAEKARDLPIFLRLNGSGLELHSIKMIEELDERLQFNEDNPDDVAEKVLHYIQLEQWHIAEGLVKDALNTHPEHAMLLHAQAILYVRYAHDAKRRAARFQRHAEEVSENWNAETHNLHLMEEAMDDMYKDGDRAFENLIKALKVWPSRIDEFSQSVIYENPRDRRNCILHLIDLAFRDVNQQRIAFDRFDKLRARELNPDRKLPSGYFFFDPSTDKVLLKALNSLEDDHDYNSPIGFGSHPYLRLKMLQLYFALDVQEYQRFGRAWLKWLENHAENNITAFFTNQHYLEENHGRIFRENLMRLQSLDESLAMLEKIKRRIIYRQYTPYRDYALELYRTRIVELFKTDEKIKAFAICKRAVRQADRESNFRPRLQYMLLRLAAILASIQLQHNSIERALRLLEEAVPFLPRNPRQYFASLQEHEYLVDHDEWFLDDFGLGDPLLPIRGEEIPPESPTGILLRIKARSVSLNKKNRRVLGKLLREFSV